MLTNGEVHGIMQVLAETVKRPKKEMCDCELSHNGLGISGHECDCEERKQLMENNRPLTAKDLAEALECFNNSAMNAFHNGNAPVCCICQGIDAVAYRLREISEQNQENK